MCIEISKSMPPWHWKALYPNDLQTGNGSRSMMTSSNGNIFRVTGHLCGEFTGPRLIHRSPVNSPHKGQWRGALMLNGWANSREAGDLRRCRDHYDVIVMLTCFGWSHFCHLFHSVSLHRKCLDYHRISNIRRTKSQNLNVSPLVLQLSLSNPFKPGVKRTIKLSAMLQLHLSYKQWHCLIKCSYIWGLAVYKIFWRKYWTITIPKEINEHLRARFRHLG